MVSYELDKRGGTINPVAGSDKKAAPPTFYVDDSGESIPPEEARFVGVKSILLAVEDDKDQRSTLDGLAKILASRYRDQAPWGISVVSNTVEAMVEINGYKKHSPQASLRGVLDYQMGLNPAPGTKKPTEALFYEPNFREMLRNGSLVTVYSGYPEQARQSQMIVEVAQNTPELVLLYAEKGKTRPEEVLMLTMGVAQASLPGLRNAAAHSQYDLKKVVDYLRSRSRASR